MYNTFRIAKDFEFFSESNDFIKIKIGCDNKLSQPICYMIAALRMIFENSKASN